MGTSYEHYWVEPKNKHVTIYSRRFYDSFLFEPPAFYTHNDNSSIELNDSNGSTGEGVPPSKSKPPANGPKMRCYRGVHVALMENRKLILLASVRQKRRDIN